MPLERIIDILKEERAVASLCEVADDSTSRSCLGELQQMRSHEVNRVLQQNQYEFGLRLLLGIIYVARREATEGQIWPSVRIGLNLCPQVADILFHSNGQPRVEVKTLIERTCRHFRLRHIFGQDGTHEWFGSIYLQFGFTQRGFSKMLPDWLMGYNRPNTIGRLLNDPELKSESFRKLWEALLSFRRGNAAEAVTLRIVGVSSWVLPEWAAELLLAAKKKPHLSPATYRSGSGEAGEAPRSFLSEPRLVVGNQLAEAQWQIELAGLAEWGLTGASFCVGLRCGESDAQEVFLRKQPDGSLSNLAHTFEIPLASVNDNQISASITDQQGREVAAQDIQLFDPDADIMVFSERGYFDDGFVKRGPRTNALCFVLVRSDLNLMPQPAEWHRFEGMGYKLHRLHFEAGQQLRVLFEDGEELWSSATRVLNNQDSLPADVVPECRLSSENYARAHDPDFKELIVEIDGMGELTLTSARWRSNRLVISDNKTFHGNSDDLQTLFTNVQRALEGRAKSVVARIPKVAALLANRVTIHLAFKDDSRTFRTSVECEIDLTGIIEQSRGKSTFDKFFSTRNYQQLRRGRYTIQPRLLTTDEQKRGLKWCLYEGDRYVCQLREGSPQPHYDLGAYGQGLNLRYERFNREAKPTPLVSEVVDSGLFDIQDEHQPIAGSDYSFDTWASPEMGTEHQLYYGLLNGCATSESAGERLVFVGHEALFSPFPEQPSDYLVLAYAGVRLATWWRVPKDGNSWSSNLAMIQETADAKRAAFTIRWAKLPIASRHYSQHVKEFFRRFPDVVLGEWLCAPQSSNKGQVFDGEDADAWRDAVRTVIQDYRLHESSLGVVTKQKLIRCLPENVEATPESQIMHTMKRVGACDPVLMGSMLCYWKSLRSVVSDRPAQSRLRQQLLEGLASANEMMAGLIAMAPETDEIFLQSIFKIGVGAVTSSVPQERDKHNLKSALTMAPFRHLLLRRIVEHYLP
jgi:hypothetical protein